MITRKPLNPYLETAGYPFTYPPSKASVQISKECGKMAVAETPLVKKNHQISVAVNRNRTITHRKSNNETYCTQAIISTSSVMRKLNEFKFETVGISLPEVMSWDDMPSRRENELHRSRFRLPKCHRHSRRKNSSNHPETTFYAILERLEIGSK